MKQFKAQITSSSVRRGPRGSRLRRALTLGLGLAAFACGEQAPEEPVGKQADPVIFDQSGWAKDVFPITLENEVPSAWGRSVGVMVAAARLSETFDDTVECPGCRQKLCDGQEFDDQYGFTGCTAFEIGPYIWATAGHCILPKEWEAHKNAPHYAELGCGQLRVIRDWTAELDVTSGAEVPAENVLECEEVLAHGPHLPRAFGPEDKRLKVPDLASAGNFVPIDDCSDTSPKWPFCRVNPAPAIVDDPTDEIKGEQASHGSIGDWAVFRVKPTYPIEAWRYLPIELGSVWKDPTKVCLVGDDGVGSPDCHMVTMVQHPFGLPQKYETAEILRGVSDHLLFARMDSGGGASGSPLISNDTGLVRSIHSAVADPVVNGVRQDKDPVEGTGFDRCVRLTQCAPPGQAGPTDVVCRPAVSSRSSQIYQSTPSVSKHWPPKGAGASPAFIEPFDRMMFGYEVLMPGGNDKADDSIILTKRDWGVMLTTTRNGKPRVCDDRFLPGPGCRNWFFLGELPLPISPAGLPQGAAAAALSGYFTNPVPTDFTPTYGPDLIFSLGGISVGVAGEDVVDGFLSLEDAISDGTVDEDGDLTEPELDEPTGLPPHLELSTNVLPLADDDYVRYEVVDVNGLEANQKFDDIAAYRADGSYDLYCGGSGGIELCTDSVLAFGRADSSVDQVDDTFTLYMNGSDVYLRQRMSECIPPAGGCSNPGTIFCCVNPNDVLPGFGTNATSRPAAIVGGNFNGDRRTRGIDLGDDLGQDIDAPVEDIAVMVSGYVVYYEATGYGAVVCAGCEDGPPELLNNPNSSSNGGPRIATGLRAGDFDADGYDDLEVSFDTEEVFLFPGGEGGLEPGNYQVLAGLPTALADDGEMLEVTSDMNVFSTQMVSFGAILDVQLFDADLGGEFDVGGDDGVTPAAFTPAGVGSADVDTCFQLWSISCDVRDLACEPSTTLVAAARSALLPDADWFTLFNGPQPGTPSPSGGYAYEMVAFQSPDGDCEVNRSSLAAIAASASSGSPDVVNAFKVRTVGIPTDVSQPIDPESQLFADLDGDGVRDLVTFAEEAGEVVLMVEVFPADSYGPVATGITSLPIESITAGNFDGSGADEIVVLSGGEVSLVEGVDEGGADVSPLGTGGTYVAVRVSDANEDGVDDLELVHDNGLITVFLGGGGGLSSTGTTYSGLPTADGGDGKLLLLSGEGLDTVASSEARFKISYDGSEDGLEVAIFDGDNGGLHQFDREVHGLKTCYRLTTDPCGDGGLGNCQTNPVAPVEVTLRDNTDFADDAWGILHSGSHEAAASFAGNGQAPYNYQLHVYFSGDCQIPPTQEAKFTYAIADAFKVRANGLVSHPVGELSFIGSDSVGDFGAGEKPYLRDTDYDGTFVFPIAVGSGATEIQLKETDADYDGDDVPGVSDGPQANIRYSLLQPGPLAEAEPAWLTGGDTAGTDLVTNPSGNNDGVSQLDVEERVHENASGLEPGIWHWKWENVGASNAVHIFAPFGSPTTFELMGASAQRVSLTNVVDLQSWRSGEREIEQFLPVVLGTVNAEGELEGRSMRIDDLAAARAMLAEEDPSSEAELRRQVLVGKLNLGLARESGERLDAALVYGATISVRTTLQQADETVAGRSAPGLLTTERLITLLRAVNQGEIIYRHPGVPFSAQPMADDDRDGVVNLKDNCPSVGNADQLDIDGDLVGDACALRPVSSCVLQRSEDRFEAFLGYDNPIDFRSIPVGARNRFVGGDADRGQPTEFLGGLHDAAFSVAFGADERLNWELEYDAVELSAASEQCSGRELFRVGEVNPVALFGRQGVTLGHDVRVVGVREQRTTVLSGGALDAGAGTLVDDVHAAGELSLGRYAEVGGALVAGSLRSDGRMTVRGEQRLDAFVRAHDISWLRSFDLVGAEEIRVRAGEHLALRPGHYASIVVEPGGSLELTASGVYETDSLIVGERASLIVGGDAVALYVASDLIVEGSVMAAFAEEMGRFMLGYFGSEAAVLAAPFEGRVLAPNAELLLGGAVGTEFVGAFFADAIEVLPGAVVRYADR